MKLIFDKNVSSLLIAAIIADCEMNPIHPRQPSLVMVEAISREAE